MSADGAIPRYPEDHGVGLVILDTVLNWRGSDGADDVSLGSIQPNDAARHAAPICVVDECHSAFRVGGAEDVLNPAAPCKYFLDGAAARGAKMEMQIYPGAYHDFDWPNLPRHELPSLRTAAGAVPI